MRSLVERAGDGQRGRHAADRVAYREPRAGGATGGLARDRHDPRHRLQLAVEGGRRPLGPSLAEARDRAVDEPRIDGRERLVAEPEPVHDAPAEVLPDDVGADYQALDNLHRLRAPEVE